MDKVLFLSDSFEYGTPQDFFDKLDEEFHFTLDPCASSSNYKCLNYYTKDDDGLSKNWGGETVFCNPPYGRGITGKWAKKCYQESLKPNTLVVMLVPAWTDTAWFHDYVYGKAELRFIRGRLHFIKDGVAQDRAAFPSLVAIYR